MKFSLFAPYMIKMLDGVLLKCDLIYDLISLNSI